ncbi:hypothetical protein C8R46DRAFT_1115370 [Mycena filopes]|nr:hypothetical protein C8R46DRAFT_1115370 [Mycena filopes]
MNSPLETHYDRSLLDHAPAATRAQLQEGYDAVLLAPNRRAKRTESHLALNEAGHGFKPEFQATPAQFPPQSRPTQSFWQRRWKPIVALLIAVVVIAAVVGGAVGATANRQTTNSSDAEGVSTVSAGDESGIISASTLTSPGDTSETATSTLAFSAVVGVETQPGVVSADIFPK